MKGSIFRITLTLAVGGAIAAALASVLIVLISPVPFNFPVSTLEIARTLRGEPVAATREPLTTSVSATLPVARAEEPFENVLRRIIAQNTGVTPDRIHFRFRPAGGPFGDRPFDIARAEYQRRTTESFRVYGGDPRMSALVFGPFEAALRGADGRWHVVRSSAQSPGPQWQVGVVKLTALALLLILPIAWWFSRRLTRPIRAFADAADRIGRGGFEHVDVDGPAEIRVAANALNDMQARIERQIAERTALIGAIAHDLRAPLARLRFLLTKAEPALAGRAESEIEQMDRMVATTIDFVHGETAQLAIERLDLRALVESVVDDFRDQGAPVTLAPGAVVEVHADPLLLRRLFTNLVSNAVRYGDTAVLAVDGDGAQARVRIDDEGPGMSAEALARAFEPFYRAEPSRNRDTGGTGLGLAIVATIVRAHGGTVDLANRAERGLSITICLPRRVS